MFTSKPYETTQPVCDHFSPAAEGLPLLPWTVVSHGAPSQPSERMMWAQSGLYRFMSRSNDLWLSFRAAIAADGSLINLLPARVRHASVEQHKIQEEASAKPWRSTA